MPTLFRVRVLTLLAVTSSSLSNELARLHALTPSRLDARTLRRRQFRLLTQAAALVAGLTAIAAASACGGSTSSKGEAQSPAKRATDAGTDTGAAARSPTSLPSGLPPMAWMPPPGVAGSKVAKRTVDSTLTSCARETWPQIKDPADRVKRIGEACATAAAAAATKTTMKPIGAMLRGSQSDRDAHQENTFHAEANHCYRLYFVGEEAVKDMVVVLRDATGSVVDESPSPAVPDDGVACFTAATDVAILVGVGSGKGAWAAQLWGN